MAFWYCYFPQLREFLSGLVSEVEEIHRLVDFAAAEGIWLGKHVAIMRSLAATTELRLVEPQLSLLDENIIHDGDFFVARLSEVGRVVLGLAKRELAKTSGPKVESLKARVHNLVEARKAERNNSTQSLAARDRHIAALAELLANAEKERDELANTCESLSANNLITEKKELLAKVAELTDAVSAIQAELDKTRYDKDIERLAREEAEEQVAQLKKTLIRNGINPYSSDADLGQAA
jgi:hypothetical protein